MSNRHNARIVAVQQLFQLHYHNELSTPTEPFTQADIANINSDNNFDAELCLSIINGVVAEITQLDAIIGKYAPEWPLDKISKIDLQILRMAIWEGFIAKITPDRVAVNEAIELSKDFSNEQSRKFINGVLGTILDDSAQNKSLI